MYGANVLWSYFVTSNEVRFCIEQPTLSNTNHSCRLSFLVISATPTPGRIITRLSRLVFWDLLPLNLGLATAKRHAQDRAA